DGIALGIHRAGVTNGVVGQADVLNEGKISDRAEAAHRHARLYDPPLRVRDLDRDAGGAKLAQVVVSDLCEMNINLDLRVLVDAQHPTAGRVADRLRQGLDGEARRRSDSLAQGYRASLLRDGPRQIVEQSGEVRILGRGDQRSKE